MSAKPSNLFPGGISNAKPTELFGKLCQADPSRYHVFDEDFFSLSASWTVVETQAGATQAITAGRGGLLLLTNSAADNDVCAVKWANASWQPLAGKQMWFYAAISGISDATQSDIAIGMQNDNTTFIDSSVTDGIFFQKDDGDAFLDFRCKKNDSTGKTVMTAVATLADATAFTIGFHFDGKSTLRGWYNGVSFGSLDPTAYFPDTTLKPVIALQNGEAVAKTMTIDRILIVSEV